MSSEHLELFYPKTKLEWRIWLQKNHIHKKSIWVVYYKKKTNQPTISWSDAVDEALCFGWIDSTKKSIDEEKCIQFFTKRKPHSTWSKINKAKVEHLIKKNQMAPAGMECINIAKQNGSWQLLDSVEELIIPQDLQKSLLSKPPAMEYFLTLSKSARKAMLAWLAMAKKQDTRQKRIYQIVIAAHKQQKFKHF